MDFNPILFEQMLAPVCDSNTIYIVDKTFDPKFFGGYAHGSIMREAQPVHCKKMENVVRGQCRYMIFSNHMNTGEDGDFYTEENARFQVLGVYPGQSKTLIMLLHLPQDDSWKIFKQIAFNLDSDILMDCITRFEMACMTPAGADEETGRPIGFDEQDEPCRE